jgi:methionine biosynthesis protein MetW
MSSRSTSRADCRAFEDHSFDHVIISQALQAMHATERILGEMLRVAGEAVVSFPNFAYRTNREAIAEGHMPVSEDLPYDWYDTPNVRFFTIFDFEACAEKLGIEFASAWLLTKRAT